MPEDFSVSAAGISFIVPTLNEEKMLGQTLDKLNASLVETGLDFEIIVVDDGSTDNSAAIGDAFEGAVIHRHPANAGYGRSLKTGLSLAKYPWIGIVDSDGSYDLDDLPALVAEMRNGFDMVVGQRTNVLKLDGPIKGLFRRVFVLVLRLLFNRYLVDPNSGFRIFRRELAEEYLPFLSERFSFTTSLTVFAAGAGAFISYVPIQYNERTGKSHVRHFRDTLRAIQLIGQGVVYTNPVKYFLLLICIFIALVAIPSGLLAALELNMAIYYFASGTVVVLLLGLAIVCDTIRIAILRQGHILKSSAASSKDTPQD